MTKEKMIKICQAGFPNRVLEQIDFSKVAMHKWGDIYRLYDEHILYFHCPQVYHLAIELNKKRKHVQFNAGKSAFNHYAAIKEMEILQLI